MLYFFAIAIIIGFLIADALMDYIFVVFYAFAATAILNDIISMIKHYKKHNEVPTDDLGPVFLHLAIGIGTFFIHNTWF